MLKKTFLLDDLGEMSKSNIYFDTNTDNYRKVNYDMNNYIFSYDEVSNNCELLIYNEPFFTPKHSPVNNDFIDDNIIVDTFQNAMNTRKFKRNEDGEVVRIADKGSINDLVKSLKLGGKRAVKNFYNYALANNWEYFTTFTFADEHTRNSVEQITYIWTCFTRYMKRLSTDFKALAIYEEFKKGGYHLHALLSDVNLTLVPARNNSEKNVNKNFLYSSSGAQIFNCADWKYGYSTVACISPESNQAQVSNYMSKYMTKASCAPFGCKRFFRTRNLNCRDNQIGYNKDFTDWLTKFNLKPVKNENGILVFRNYGTKFIELKKSIVDKCEDLSSDSFMDCEILNIFGKQTSFL